MRSSFQCPTYLIRCTIGRHNKDLRSRALGNDLSCRIGPAHDRHVKIHCNKIRLELPRQRKGLSTVLRLTDNLHTPGHSKNRHQPCPHERVIINYQDVCHSQPP